MMIKKCSICGRLVHESSKCPYCGHENCFIPVENQVRVHKNVKTEYDKLKELIKKEKYTDAIEVSHYVLEWTPTTSEVFWIRLLARNGCKNDAQLIQKGFEYEESADFFNAFKYGSDAEKTVYQEVRKTVEEIRSALADAVRQHEYEEKKATQIVKLREEMTDEIEQKRSNLFNLWSQLEKKNRKCILLNRIASC